jgi:hypothetical protein
MKLFSKVLAGLGAVLLTAILMALPDLSMAKIPGATIAAPHCLVASR